MKSTVVVFAETINTTMQGRRKCDFDGININTVLSHCYSILGCVAKGINISGKFLGTFQCFPKSSKSWKVYKIQNVSRNVLPLCNPNSVWFLMWSDCFFNIARVSLVVVWRSLGYLRWLLGCYAGFTFQCFFFSLSCF